MTCKVYYDGSLVHYTTMVFSGGELQVKFEGPKVYPTPVPDGHFRIEANLWSANDIMELLLLTDALKRRYKPAKIDLYCPYFPYARQDRVCATGEALSVKVLADIINLQNYSKVIIWDAHSDVTPALLNNVENVSCLSFVINVVTSFDKNPIIVAPDGGARKKVFEVAKATGCEFLQAEKIRNVQTGEITETKVDWPHIYPHNADFLIVDDICDGGRTFIELAKVLYPYSKSIGLYVTHGIFSKGIEVLHDGLIGNIYCPNVKDKQIRTTKNYKVIS